MKRRSTSRTFSSSMKKISRKDIVPNALDKFRNGLSSPDEFSTEMDILHFAELKKKKVIEEFMPLIMKSTVHQVYDMVVELEAGIQEIIQDFLRKWVPPDEALPHCQGYDRGSDMEEENVEVHTIVKTEIDDMTVAHDWSWSSTDDEAAWPELEDNNVEDGICIVQSFSLEKLTLDRDPSVRTEILSKFLENDSDAPVNLFQSSVNVNQWRRQEHRSSSKGDVQEVPRPEIAGESISNVNVEEAKKFEKLESLILQILDEIRYPEAEEDNNEGLNVPVYVDRLNILDSLDKMKRLLKKFKTWSNRQYQELHARLLEVVKTAAKVLSNARVQFRPEDMFVQGRIRPALVDEEDYLMWCLAFDVDVRECLPSERGSPNFKLDRVEYEINFMRTLIDSELIEDQEIKLKWEGEYLGQRLLDLVTGQCQEMKARHSSDLCVEAVYFFWKFRAQSLDWPWGWEGSDLDRDSDNEAESETTDSEDGDDYESISDDDEIMSRADSIYWTNEEMLENNFAYWDFGLPS